MDRSVASMTTEQLYRKRAFDRINQRTARARKKTRIVELEEEVAELKCQLAQSNKHIEHLQASEASLRTVIRSACSALQAVAPSPSVHLAASPSSFPSTPQTPPSAIKALELDHSSTLAAASGFTSSDMPASRLRDENMGLTMGISAGEHVPLDTMFPVWGDNFQPDMTGTNAFSLAFLDAISSEGFPTSSSPNFQMHSGITIAQEPCAVPLWERIPLHVESTTRLDTVMLHVLQSSQQHHRDPGSIPELSAPVFPSIGSLLNPDYPSAQSPISSAIGQHGRITMDIPNLATKLAAMYNMCVVLRWMVSPTKRNYYAMPEHLRPREVQLTVPHPAWVDVVVW
jgi:hypothetical protein